VTNKTPTRDNLGEIAVSRWFDDTALRDDGLTDHVGILTDHLGRDEEGWTLRRYRVEHLEGALSDYRKLQRDPFDLILRDEDDRIFLSLGLFNDKEANADDYAAMLDEIILWKKGSDLRYDGHTEAVRIFWEEGGTTLHHDQVKPVFNAFLASPTATEMIEFLTKEEIS
jgi:hypothetical protein